MRWTESIKQIFSQRIARSIVTGSLLFILIFLSVIISIQLYLDYNAQLEQLEESLERVENSFMPSITNSLWYFDMQMLSIQLEGIRENRSFTYVAIKQDGIILLSSGEKEGGRLESRSFKLEYNRNGKVTDLGSLELIIDREIILNYILERALLIIITETLAVISLLFFILIIFYYLVGRPLFRITNYMNRLQLNNLKKALIVYPDSAIPRRENELSELAASINRVIDNLRISYFSIIKSNAMLNREIDERKKIETELSKTKGFLQNIIESMPSTIFTINYEGNIMLWNKSLFLIEELEDKDVIGKNILSVIPQLKKFHKELDSIKESRKPLYFHNQRLSDISSSYYDISFFPLLTDGIEGIVIRIDDVTELNEIESQLVQSQKMETIGTLAGGLAHDFNNVLSGIVSSVSLIQYEIENDCLSMDELPDYLETIYSSGERAADIVKQLLALSRKNNLSLRNIDLNTPIDNVLKICKNSFDKIVSLELLKLDSPAMVKADITQIEQIILNICINGYHAMTIMREDGEKKGGKLKVRLDRVYVDEVTARLHHSDAEVGDYFLIRVIDNGIGMSKEVLDKIFEPFYTTKGKGVGTGLGLSMVYNIVKQHNGFITVSSEVGRGTTFSLYIPQLKEEANEEKGPERAVDIKGKGLILVVDDEDIVRRLAEKILKKVGYQVIMAKDGLEGLEKFKERYKELDCILLDISMPKMSGEDVYLEMIKIDPGVNVIITSGFEEDRRVKNLKSMGIAGFIRKPFNLNELSIMIKRAIENRG